MPRCNCAADQRLARHLFAVLRSAKPNALQMNDDFDSLPTDTQADFERLAKHIRLEKHKHVLTE